MPLRILQTDLHVLNMFTRMPFRYGIATLTALPHLFLRATVEIDGRAQVGIASEGLAPKWFTKDPDAPVEREIDDMLTVIRAACGHAQSIGRASSVFDLWRELYDAQSAWAADTPHPPLLSNLGVSLVERAVLDAFCKAGNIPFARALRTDALGIDLARVHESLGDARPAELLPAEPPRSIIARHTVGLSDPLTDGEIPPGERLGDGLPQSLETCIERYGLTHFKIKVPADPHAAIHRLRSLANIIPSDPDPPRFTLDGNEFFRDIDGFRELWQSLLGQPDVRVLLERGLLFVEQPLHRDVALSDDVARALERWPDRPVMIIDESDGEIGSLTRALKCGYAGTSHKNCKGVMKGVANTCLIAKHRREDPDGRYIMSGEDLANVGPIALLQDLAVVASLGLEHVERNGHHYFAGLAAFPDDLQQAVIERHHDLYHWHAAGDARFPSLSITSGKIALNSVVDAPFGCDIKLAPSRFTPLNKWRARSLMGE